MKFIIILLLNCFLVLCSILYFIDHPFTRASVTGKIKQLVLLLLSVCVLYNVLFIYLLKKKKVENGLIYKIIAFAEKLIHDSMIFIQPIQKEFIISLIIAFVLIVLGMLLAGLPGAAVISVLQKTGLLHGIQGDNAWPAAILLSIAWPLCFPFAILTKQFLLHCSYVGFAGLSILLGLVWIVFIVPVTALLFTKKS